MTTNHRLFVDAPLANDRTLSLPAEASHYLARVLRLRAGAVVTLFNGDGNNYAAELLSADKKSSELRVLSERPGPHSQPNLNLAIALLKGDKLDLALQKATELDVDTVWLTKTARCELRLNEKRLANRMTHWRRIMISACEQSGRTSVPTLHAPQSLDEVLAATQSLKRYCLEPSANAGELKVSTENVCLFTGPEGGFDDKETQLLQQSTTSVQLGELVLRAETAPIVGLALLGASRRIWARQAAGLELT